MPSTKRPQLGSLAIQEPVNPPQVVHVSPATCHDLSLFKDILKEYRRLDDTIVMRLNRANATMRDQERLQDHINTTNVQEQACLNMWRELVGNWNRRSQLVEYCAFVVDQSLAEKRKALEEQSTDPVTQRKIQATVFADGVKRNQIHNELTIESIVQKRSIEAFRSRCQYFSPPKTDIEGHRVWDSV
ncbi:caffeine-induced death protein 2-domain-containing protein [Collybia nuda]|uniref:Caffeine-induced death protein 2-domain-containing protein n=1 Tax=Collybia nuda TaxID=64659 RepID=A0A9P6CEA0_9AGAR|nr:caffeine-induced death protein 2-domain-containing protein [Collybia nuda]